MIRVETPEGVDPIDVALEERVDVLRMQSFSLDARADTTQVLPVAVGIDATTWAAATVVVVVHFIEAFAADARLEIAVQAIELDPDDPKQIFTALTIASIKLDSSTVAGTAVVKDLTAPWGSRLQVALRLFQGSVEATKEQRCTLSIWLVGRRRGLIGAPRVLQHRANDR